MINKDIFWVASGQILSAVAMFLTIKVWAVYLSPGQLGLLALLVGTASILTGIVGGPLLQSILVTYPSYHLDGDGRSFRYVSGVMLRNYVLSISFIVIIAGVPLSLFFKLKAIAPFFIAFMFMIDSYRIFEQRLFAASQRQKYNAITSGLDPVFRMIFVWFFLHHIKGDAYSAMAGSLFGAFIFACFMRFAFRLEAYPGDKTVSKAMRDRIKTELLKLAKPLFPSLILANITEMGNRYFIAALLGLQATGLFTVSYGFVKRPYGMLNHVGEIIFTPVLKSAIVRGDSERPVKIRRAWLAFIIGFSLVGAALFYLLREQLVLFFLSGKYARASDLLSGLALAVTLFNVANIFNWFSMTLGDSRAVLLNNIVGSAATVILTVALGIWMGLSGVVWALGIGYGVQLTASYFTYRKNLARHAGLKQEGGARAG